MDLPGSKQMPPLIGLFEYVLVIIALQLDHGFSVSSNKMSIPFDQVGAYYDFFLIRREKAMPNPIVQLLKERWAGRSISSEAERTRLPPSLLRLGITPISARRKPRPPDRTPQSGLNQQALPSG